MSILGWDKIPITVREHWMLDFWEDAVNAGDEEEKKNILAYCKKLDREKATRIQEFHEERNKILFPNGPGEYPNVERQKELLQVAYTRMKEEQP